MNAYPFQKSPRCIATSKRTRQPCKAPAVRGYRVCRFHGARSGAPSGKANGAYRHGLYSSETAQDRRLVSAVLAESRRALALCQDKYAPKNGRHKGKAGRHAKNTAPQ